MAHGKSLELNKIKPADTTIGSYAKVGNKMFREFVAGDIVYSRDGTTKYLVQKDGSFRRVTAAMENLTKIVKKVSDNESKEN
jgi:hypothetical protein